jgi:predicted RNase H-like HicB family nuclease
VRFSRSREKSGQGETREEAIANLRAATELYLEELLFAEATTLKALISKA